MTLALVLIFVAGYLFITLEHPLRLNKAAFAMITGVACWLVLVWGGHDTGETNRHLLEHLGDIASILFFLLGAMTIVELIDLHDGFEVIKQKVRTQKKPMLLLVVTLLTFWLSAVLDNLTTAILMTTLLSKFLSGEEDRFWFAGMIIIAANAGGAWSPMGDVTTTMLWIGGQVTAFNIMVTLILPSIAVCALPLGILMVKFRGQTILHPEDQVSGRIHARESNGVLISGILLLLLVPVFKVLTHLPPFMGMLLSLGLMWIITTLIHFHKKPDHRRKYSVAGALEKIDASSILFFLGILLAVAALETQGMLKQLAVVMDQALGNYYAVGTALGLISALVDNVPLVAAAQGMYDMQAFPTDHPFWEFVALTTGTGGSAIIIGSAAGVAVMGIEKIHFMWYLKRISWLALAGFISGILVFWLQENYLFRS